MITVTSKNLLEFIVAFFISMGCDPAKAKAYFSARRFTSGIVLNLPAVCLVKENKPTASKSNQSHIHVTSKAREFFFPASVLSSVTASTPWKRQALMLMDANIASLNNVHDGKSPVVTGAFTQTDTSMMMKIECRKTQEKQVQLSKLKDGDDSKFLDLRRGLYENDLLVFLRYRGSDKLFVVGVPRSFYDGKYTFDSSRKAAGFKSEMYPGLESNNAIPVKVAMKKVLEEHTGDDVIESEDPITDAIYQSAVDAAEATSTDYEPVDYEEKNPNGTTTTSHRPPTNPGIGKEAIKDNSFCCAVDRSHATFKKPDGTQYMEAHHLIPLNQQYRFKKKLDCKANIVPLCPNCHSRFHHGGIDEIKPVLKHLYDERKETLKKSGLDISFDDLLACY